MKLSVCTNLQSRQHRVHFPSNGQISKNNFNLSFTQSSVCQVMGLTPKSVRMSKKTLKQKNIQIKFKCFGITL